MTVDGDELDALWQYGVRIYIDGLDLEKPNIVLIEGAPHAVTDLRRRQITGGLMTLRT